MKKLHDSRVYEKGQDFFDLSGSCTMFLSAAAAFEVINLANQKHLAISRIEGFFWHRDIGKFEARLDAIFDGLCNPASEADVIKNNERAKLSTEDDVELGHEVFIITIVQPRRADENLPSTKE